MPKQTNLRETRKYCYLCVNNIVDVDYKDTQLLRRFISSYMKIVPTRRSGVCAAHQRKIQNSIKRARFMSLLAYVPR